ncbi:MAG: DNA primase small subunit domain-containing protein [Promethearchaeota archaeon]
MTFLIKHFADYYRNPTTPFTPPRQFESREFAFFWFDREGVFRHTNFVNPKELVEFISKEGPAHIFHSAAYYDIPDAPQMPLKGWRGADLVFDIDADHFDLPCQQQHDSWSCLDCDHRGHGNRPEQCPRCNSTRVKAFKWMCEECLSHAKAEAIKIIENFLIPDMGLSTKDIMVVFSGHRGYHIHSIAPELHTLGSQERREIVDYISGTGIEYRYHGFVEKSYGVPKGPDSNSPGWEGKIAEGIQRLFRNPQQLGYIPGLRANQIRLLQDDAPAIYKQLTETPPRYITPKGVGQKAWYTITQYVVESLAAVVDEPVTTDIHRLIRLPGSLHGKTGFLVKKLELSDLDNFDPFKDAQVFSGTTTVHVLNAPAFTLNGKHYPPMREIKKELPLSAAMLLLCKGVAELVN